MLQRLNEGIKGWIATIIVVALSLSFIIFGISYYLDSHSGSSAVVAKVGSISITNQQLESEFRRVQFQQEQQHGVMSKEDLVYLKKIVLDGLIQQAVQIEAMNKLGLRAPKQVIEEAIEGLSVFQRDGQYDPELLQQRLIQNGITLSQLMQQVGEQLVQQQLNIGISSSTFLLPQSLQGISQWALQTRSFRYVAIPAENFLAGVKVSSQDLQAYYQSNQSNYTLPDRVQISYLSLSPIVLAKTVNVTPAEIEQYYQANQNQFRLPSTYRYADVVVLRASNLAEQAKRQQEANAINTALKTGQSLQSMAAQFGGSVQSTIATQLNPAVLSLLQTMRPGQILPEQDIDTGKLWLQLIAVEPGPVRSLEQVRSQIKAMLVNQRVSAKMASMTGQLSDLTYTQSNSLQPAAEALGLLVKQSSWISKQGLKAGLFSDKKIMNAAFSDEVLEQGNNSMPITLSDGSVVVLRVKARKKAQVQPFDKVKTQVMKQVQQQAAQLQAALFAMQLQERLEKKQPVSNLLAAHHLSWKQQTGVMRTDKNLPPAVLEAVFALQSAPAISSVVDGVVMTVVQLQSIRLPRSAPTEGELLSLSQTLRSYYANMDMAAVLTAVEKSIPVKRYPERIP